VGPASANDFQSEPVNVPGALPVLTVVFADRRQVTVPLLGGETLAVERSWREDGLDRSMPLWSGALGEIAELRLVSQRASGVPRSRCDTEIGRN
jgi:hypothetical protein